MSGHSLTLDQWIAIASSVGTVLAAAIAAISIREIRRQDEAKYRPRITIGEASLQVAIDRKNYRWKSADASEDDNNIRSHDITLLNVGNGVATHVNVEWRYDIKEWVDACNAVTASTTSQVSCITLYADWLDINIDKRFRGMIRRPETMVRKLDYLVPVTSQTPSRTIYLDLCLQTLASIYYMERFEAHGTSPDTSLSLDPPSDLFLSATYRDTIGRDHKEIIPVTLTLQSWQHSTEKNNAIASFGIERKFISEEFVAAGGNAKTKPPFKLPWLICL